MPGAPKNQGDRDNLALPNGAYSARPFPESADGWREGWNRKHGLDPGASSAYWVNQIILSTDHALTDGNHQMNLFSQPGLLGVHVATLSASSEGSAFPWQRPSKWVFAGRPIRWAQCHLWASLQVFRQEASCTPFSGQFFCLLSV